MNLDEDDKTIPATQFMRPDGRQVEGWFTIECPRNRARALELIRRGYRFTFEILTTGHVSMAIEGPDPTADWEVGDIAVAIYRNEPLTLESIIGETLDEAEAILGINPPAEQ